MQNLIVNPSLTSKNLIHIANCIMLGVSWEKKCLNSKETIEYFTINDGDENEYSIPCYVHTEKTISDYKQWEDEVDWSTDELEINVCALLVPESMSNMDLEFESDFIKDKIMDSLYGDEKEVAEIYVTL